MPDEFKNEVDAVPLTNLSIAESAKWSETNAWSTVDGENENEDGDDDLDILPLDSKSNLRFPQDHHPAMNLYKSDMEEIPCNVLLD